MRKGFYHQPENSRLAIGDLAPYLSLQGTDGHIYSLDNLKGKTALTVIFTSNYCPKCQEYEQHLVELAQHYSELGVSFAAICSNDSEAYPEDSFEKMAEKSETLGNPFPYLQDISQTAARTFDAACTPEVYVFDRELKLQYHGGIEDESPEQSDTQQGGLKAALDCILAGKRPFKQITPCFGCSIKWKVGKS